MSQEQLEAALQAAGRRAEELVAVVLAEANKDGVVLDQDQMAATAFMYATVSASMFAMSRRLFRLSRIKAQYQRSMEKGARVYGHQIVDHVKFEDLSGKEPEADQPNG